MERYRPARRRSSAARDRDPAARRSPASCRPRPRNAPGSGRTGSAPAGLGARQHARSRPAGSPAACRPTAPAAAPRRAVAAGDDRARVIAATPQTAQPLQRPLQHQPAWPGSMRSGTSSCGHGVVPCGCSVDAHQAAAAGGRRASCPADPARLAAGVHAAVLKLPLLHVVEQHLRLAQRLRRLAVRRQQRQLQFQPQAAVAVVDQRQRLQLRAELAQVAGQRRDEAHLMRGALEEHRCSPLASRPIGAIMALRQFPPQQTAAPSAPDPAARSPRCPNARCAWRCGRRNRRPAAAASAAPAPGQHLEQAETGRAPHRPPARRRPSAAIGTGQPQGLKWAEWSMAAALHMHVQVELVQLQRRIRRRLAGADSTASPAAASGTACRTGPSCCPADRLHHEGAVEQAARPHRRLAVLGRVLGQADRRRRPPSSAR